MSLPTEPLEQALPLPGGVPDPEHGELSVRIPVPPSVPRRRRRNADGSLTEVGTLAVPADGAPAALTVGAGASEHSLRIEGSGAAVGGDVTIELEVEAYDGTLQIKGLEPRQQLAGSVVTISATSAVAGLATKMFDAGRVRLRLPHCHAGPPARLRVLHERVTVSGWKQIDRGAALADGTPADLGFRMPAEWESHERSFMVFPGSHNLCHGRGSDDWYGAASLNWPDVATGPLPSSSLF